MGNWIFSGGIIRALCASLLYLPRAEKIPLPCIFLADWPTMALKTTQTLLDEQRNTKQKCKKGLLKSLTARRHTQNNF